VQGAGQQNIAAGENLSQNAASSRSGGSFSFSGENSGGTPSQTDSLGGSPSGSAPDHLDRAQSAQSGAASGAQAQEMASPISARSPSVTRDSPRFSAGGSTPGSSTSTPSATSSATPGRADPLHPTNPDTAASGAADSTSADARFSLPSNSAPPPVASPPRTRASREIVKPREYKDGTVRWLLSCTTSAEPKNLSSALTDPNWMGAMDEEFGALMQNNTWKLVPPHRGKM
jgi:hypothetical protein